MKNLFYLILILLLVSCGSSIENNEDIQIGYEILKSGEKVTTPQGRSTVRVIKDMVRVGIHIRVMVWVVDRTIPLWMRWIKRPRLWTSI